MAEQGKSEPRKQMPWVIRDVVNDVNKAVARRWQVIDPLLPEPGDLPAGCMAPLLARGDNGRPAGIGVCRHQHVRADTLAQTWGAATRFSLTLRLRDADTGPAVDDLLTQWRAHLNRQPEVVAPDGAAADTAAIVNWPSRDITGVLPLLRHGLVPLTVIAARSRPAGANPPSAKPLSASKPGPVDIDGLVIRPADPSDLAVVTEFEMGVIRYDAHFGAAVPRPGTEALVRAESLAGLAKHPGWTFLAEQAGRPVALATVEPPAAATWIAGMTRAGTTAYLQTMFVRAELRGTGIGAALVRHVHGILDALGIDVTVLHHAQQNPRSAPFWHQMGYRPLWTTWEARPAATLR
jgi:GNAT superfamily N-acetyltransferase